jgi:acyl transferase domain-containing protein
MATPPITHADAGAMMAVKMASTQVEEVIRAFPQVAIANLNSPQQVVLAGARSALESLQQQLQHQGEMATILPVAAAFHTPLVAYAQKPFAKAIETVKFNSPQISVYTNATGQKYPDDPTAIRKILKDHLLNRVQFQQEIETIYAEGGFCFIEFGPKATLTNLVKEILGESPHIAVALNASSNHDSDRQLREAVLQLRVVGLALGNIDPYGLPPLPTDMTKPHQSLNVRLGASNYVSDKAKLAFEKALQNGNSPTPAPPKEVARPLVSASTPRISNGKPPTVPSVPIADRSPPVPSATNGFSSVPVSPPPQPAPEMESQIMAHSSLDASRLFQQLDGSLAQLRQHQSETLQVHAQYLSHQMEYAKLFWNLAQQQGALYADFAQGDKNREMDDTQLMMLQSLDRNLAHFHAHQTQTLELHGRSLDHQTEYARSLFHLAEHQYRTILQDGSAHIHNGVSQPEVASQNGAPATVQMESPTIEFQPPQLAVVSSPSPALAVDTRELEPILLAIVSEKTGYPSEMLELGMDMEADLGIDSIKRVEILGALQERFPSSVQPNLEDLAELRTLAQITTYMVQLSTIQEDKPIHPEVSVPEESEAVLVKNGHHGNGFHPSNGSLNNGNGFHQRAVATPPMESRNGGHRETATAIAPPLAEPLTVISPLPELDLAHPLALQHPNSPTTVSDIDTETLGQSLLEIVGEKTGYPVEMLELDMDMEADLGIDSIKRVEILGAAQERVPNLPQPNLEDLAELRTLGQIVSFLSNQTTEKKTTHLELIASTPS